MECFAWLTGGSDVSTAGEADWLPAVLANQLTRVCLYEQSIQACVVDEHDPQTVGEALGKTVNYQTKYGRNSPCNQMHDICAFNESR